MHHIPHNWCSCIEIVTGASWNMNRCIFTSIKSHGFLLSCALKSFRELHSHTMFTGSSPDGKNTVRLITPWWRRESTLVDVWCFRATDCVTIIWWLQKLDRLLVCKEAAWKFDTERLISRGWLIQKSRNSMRLKYQIVLQVWKIWMMIMVMIMMKWTSVWLGKLLEKV
jgi:hypothetical protein